MVRIARADAPWVWGFHPKDYGLAHAWVRNVKPNQMARNGVKFYLVDTVMREEQRAEWNRPRVWPIAAAVALLVATAVPAFVAYRRRERAAARPA
jgi:hypothetical protein